MFLLAGVTSVYWEFLPTDLLRIPVTYVLLRKR